jgi:hypothetical protein
MVSNVQKRRIRVPVIEFVKAVDASENFEEVADRTGQAVESVYQRYKQIHREWPGIFQKELTRRGRTVDLLEDVAKLRGISKEELIRQMDERKKNMAPIKRRKPRQKKGEEISLDRDTIETTSMQNPSTA